MTDRPTKLDRELTMLLDDSSTPLAPARSLKDSQRASPVARSLSAEPDLGKAERAKTAEDQPFSRTPGVDVSEASDLSPINGGPQAGLLTAISDHPLRLNGGSAPDDIDGMPPEHSMSTEVHSAAIEDVQASDDETEDEDFSARADMPEATISGAEPSPGNISPTDDANGHSKKDVEDQCQIPLPHKEVPAADTTPVVALKQEPPPRRKPGRPPGKSKKAVEVQREVEQAQSTPLRKKGDPPGVLDKLYVCEGCFKYMVHPASYATHLVRALPPAVRLSSSHQCRQRATENVLSGVMRTQRACKARAPPGRKVYQRGAHTIWEVDGSISKVRQRM